jgi:hypothetical protein
MRFCLCCLLLFICVCSKRLWYDCKLIYTSLYIWSNLFRMFQLHVYPSYSLFVVPQLLLRPKFSAVEKIKTIGSTYMAASGLSPGNQVHTCKEICTWCISVWYLVLQGRDDWRFLYLLVEFAFQLQSRLEQINKHSFQTFSLRIGVVIRITELEYHHLRFMVIVLGITHGPLVAGVIGARKPQYDIWGNTVNMASRMESTGTFGKIQVQCTMHPSHLCDCTSMHWLP